MNKYWKRKGQGKSINNGVGRVIGVTGTVKGCGVTHVSMLIANALSRKGGSYVACVDYGNRNSYSQLLDRDCDMDSFCYKGVTYCMCEDTDSLAKILNEGYQHIVIDFGSESKGTMKELLRSDIKVVIGLGAPWKRGRFEEFISEYEEVINKGTWRFVFNLTTGNVIKQIRRRYGIRAANIGYEESVFDLKNDRVNEIVELVQ